MKNEEKAKFIADQCKPCSHDFYHGMYQGVLLTLRAEESELKFDKETAEALYRIFCGLSSNCYENAEVYEEAKPNMKKAYEKVLDWGRKNCDDTRGETLKSE